MSPQNNRNNSLTNRRKQTNSNNSSNHQSAFFINRRVNARRSETDPCEELSIDLYNRKRRKSTDRRKKNKTLVDDFYSVTKRTVTEKTAAQKIVTHK